MGALGQRADSVGVVGDLDGDIREKGNEQGLGGDQNPKVSEALMAVLEGGIMQVQGVNLNRREADIFLDGRGKDGLRVREADSTPSEVVSKRRAERGEDDLMGVCGWTTAVVGGVGVQEGGVRAGVSEREVGDDRKMQSGEKGGGVILDCGSGIQKSTAAGSGEVVVELGSGQHVREEEGCRLSTVHQGRRSVPVLTEGHMYGTTAVGLGEMLAEVGPGQYMREEEGCRLSSVHRGRSSVPVSTEGHMHGTTAAGLGVVMAEEGSGQHEREEGSCWLATAHGGVSLVPVPAEDHVHGAGKSVLSNSDLNSSFGDGLVAENSG